MGYFICNSELDQNGSSFLAGTDSIRFIGRSDLEGTFVSSDRNLPTAPPAVFNISGYETSEYIVDADHSAIIAPIKASELVGLDGIANQEIFAFNVRGPLGKTQVNRDIAKSITDDSKHKLFPLFHNGITIMAESVDRTDDEITVDKYFVVNGCQSLNALYKNSRHITDNLRILTKFIQTPPTSTLSEMITRISNNQNGVKARDFKSNNQIQIRLQNEFEALYNGRFFFEIKRGEDARGVSVISNELAGQYLMSFDLKTPWSTHRKYQIFEDKHSDLFGRPSVTAHKIVLCDVIATTIQEHQASISNELFAKYILTRFFILYIVRLILESDDTASDVLDAPELYVHDEGAMNAFASTIGKLLDEVITDLNAGIDQLADDFDYRGKLRDEHWCNTLAHEIAATHEKLVSRGRMESFGELFAQQVAAADS
ncbi:AIPR family protein [Thiocapsa bogorovii]|uniref:AIPR family protein n=1 Tax=Thiocapsa bogorovii TaxID=521689 RepID=UPI001E28E4C7|nr:AIPR family protein [Thiocapsa bogorovii]UHD15272.1 AIPR family protein [Thiocapsa bogorovii]